MSRIMQACVRCTDDAAKPNMFHDHNGELICPECATDASTMPDDAPEMPTLEDIELA